MKKMIIIPVNQVIIEPKLPVVKHVIKKYIWTHFVDIMKMLAIIDVIYEHNVKKSHILIILDIILSIIVQQMEFVIPILTDNVNYEMDVMDVANHLLISFNQNKISP